jgi:hypothetical protein
MAFLLQLSKRRQACNNKEANAELNTFNYEGIDAQNSLFSVLVTSGLPHQHQILCIIKELNYFRVRRCVRVIPKPQPSGRSLLKDNIMM